MTGEGINQGGNKPIPTLANELTGLIIAYVKQETVVPIKSLGSVRHCFRRGSGPLTRRRRGHAHPGRRAGRPGRDRIAPARQPDLGSLHRRFDRCGRRCGLGRHKNQEGH